MLEGGQLMVVLIVAIVMVASIVKARYGYGRHGRRNGGISAEEHAENLRLREEVKQLKDRLQVLERITVDKENSVARQIEELRDR